MEPIGRWLVWRAEAVFAGCCGVVGVSIEAELDWCCKEGAFGSGLLCKTFAEAFVVVLASGSLHATVLGLGAVRNAAGARKVRDAEVEEDREVRSQIAWREPEVCFVKSVASVLMDSPRLRAPGHDEEAGAVFVGHVEVSNAPQMSITRAAGP